MSQFSLCHPLSLFPLNSTSQKKKKRKKKRKKREAYYPPKFSLRFCCSYRVITYYPLSWAFLCSISRQEKKEKKKECQLSPLYSFSIGTIHDLPGQGQGVEKQLATFCEKERGIPLISFFILISVRFQFCFKQKWEAQGESIYDFSFMKSSSRSRIIYFSRLLSCSS